MTHYLYILGTILFTVYGQIVIKWRITQYGEVPTYFGDKLTFVLTLLKDPFIVSGLAAGFLAAVSWMGAMTRFQLSYAYPFTSISFILVLFLGSFLFNEPLTWNKIAGLVFISLGIAIGSQG